MQTLYNAQLENACSEQGARMSAMDSSSRNASDMLGRLTLSYNRCACKASRPTLCQGVEAPHLSLSPGGRSTCTEPWHPPGVCLMSLWSLD